MPGRILPFTLSDEYIELIKLLKLTGIAVNGAEAKELVRNGHVSCNGIVESRLRFKVRSGTEIRVHDTTVKVDSN